MKVQFEQDDQQEELLVSLKKFSRDAEVEAVLAYLNQLGQVSPDIVPVKTGDRIQMLRVAELIAVEVEGNNLRLYTLTGQLLTTDRLYKFQARVNNPNLVQVSKQTLLNIAHLDYLEASFSGNMTAFLSRGVKVTVSRRYLKALEQKLGL